MGFGAGLADLWARSDPVARAVALLLLAMSVAAWVLIVWRAWQLGRVRADIARALPAFWAAPTVVAGCDRVAELDRSRVLMPLVDAALATPTEATLQQSSPDVVRRARLRAALHAAAAQLRRGQTTLASIASAAPFVGLFGTVWAVHHALTGIAAAGSAGLDQVAAPIGEALLMTAAGIAVAVPAMLGYNVFGRRIAACEAALDGWAHDLHALPPADG